MHSLFVFFSLQRSGQAPVIFLFVVDTCQDEENLQALKVATLPHTHAHTHTHTHLCACLDTGVCLIISSLSASDTGVSAALSESHTTDCFGGTHHLWQDGTVDSMPHYVLSEWQL